MKRRVQLFCFLLVIGIPGSVFGQAPSSVNLEKEAHLAGSWYSDQAKTLGEDLERYLRFAHHNFPVTGSSKDITALIVPHAGHYYSGYAAASAFATLATIKPNEIIPNQRIRKVIIVAPSHHSDFTGIAIPDFQSYNTPLGSIPVAQSDMDKLSEEGLFSFRQGVFGKEHSLEIQLPFLQKVLDRFSMVPLIVGSLNESECMRVAGKLNELMNDSTLVVISSDFTHQGSNYSYRPFRDQISDRVKRLDSRALDCIVRGNYQDFEQYISSTKATICGRDPIRIFLKWKHLKSLKSSTPRLACYYTSAHLIRGISDGNLEKEELAGSLKDSENQNSVSYISMVYTAQNLRTLDPGDQMTGYEKLGLITSSREKLTNLYADQPKPDSLLWPIISPGISLNSGSFVTINTSTHQLRGCIGRIISEQPLYKTVIDMTESAALYDRRFEKVKRSEIQGLFLEISVLTPPRRVQSHQEIRIGTHGIYLTRKTAGKSYSAVFLPQVATEQGWDRETTLHYLSQKAGLDGDAWKTNCVFDVFEGFEIKEKGY